MEKKEAGQTEQQVSGGDGGRSYFWGALAAQPRGAWLEGNIQCPSPARPAENQGHALPRQPVPGDQVRQKYKGLAILAQHGAALKVSAFSGVPQQTVRGFTGPVPPVRLSCHKCDPQQISCTPDSISAAASAA